MYQGMTLDQKIHEVWLHMIDLANTFIHRLKFECLQWFYHSGRPQGWGSWWASCTIPWTTPPVHWHSHWVSEDIQVVQVWFLNISIFIRHWLYNWPFRDIVAEYMLSVGGGYMVGGYNTTIEIDESMFGNNIQKQIVAINLDIYKCLWPPGKRKYHKGRISGRRQCWVLGGVVRWYNVLDLICVSLIKYWHINVQYWWY